MMIARVSQTLSRAVVLLAFVVVTLFATAASARVRTAVAYRPRPVARAAAVVTTAAVTTAVVGSVVRSLPPSCSSVVVGDVAYQQCENSWYRPAYAGSQVTYTVVDPPR